MLDFIRLIFFFFHFESRFVVVNIALSFSIWFGATCIENLWPLILHLYLTLVDVRFKCKKFPTAKNSLFLKWYFMMLLWIMTSLECPLIDRYIIILERNAPRYHRITSPHCANLSTQRKKNQVYRFESVFQLSTSPPEWLNILRTHIRKNRKKSVMQIKKSMSSSSGLLAHLRWEEYDTKFIITLVLLRRERYHFDTWNEWFFWVPGRQCSTVFDPNNCQIVAIHHGKVIDSCFWNFSSTISAFTTVDVEIVVVCLLRDRFF